MNIDFSYLRELLENPHQLFCKQPMESDASLWRKAFCSFADSLERNVRSHGVKVTKSCGKGRWANFPWIRLAFPCVSVSNSRGVFIDYLFGWNDHQVYLTLLQGVDGIPENERNGKLFTIKKLIQDNVESVDFEKTPLNWKLNINGSCAKINRAQSYANGMIFYKLYTNVSLTDENQLGNDLHKLIEIYRCAVDILTGKKTM
ncbi:MAG: DUF3578 domain-containing protein [Treponema sp.]|nr:DUF3578 domain-containing protein [Treponema sp.]